MGTYVRVVFFLRSCLSIQADPLLTPLGEEQARTVNQAWRTEIPFGVPLPEKLYCSPLTRALRTNELTFEGIFADGRKTIVVEVIVSFYFLDEVDCFEELP